MTAALVGAAVLLAPTPCLAGAWTRAPGNVYAKLAYGSSTAADQYTFDGRVKPYADNVDGASFFDRSVYIYAEGGLAEGFTLVIGGSYKRVFVLDEVFRYERTRLADARLGLRVDLGQWLTLPGGLAWSVEGWAEGPTGYVRNTIPAPGAGNLDLGLMLEIGRGWSQFYAQGGIGLRARTGWHGLSRTIPCSPGIHRGCVPAEEPDPGDEGILRVEVGWVPAPWLVVLASTEATLSFVEPQTGFSVDQPTPTHRRLVKSGVGLMLRPWKALSFESQLYVTPWGQNAVDSFDLFLGLSTEFDLLDLLGLFEGASSPTPTRIGAR